MIGENLRHLRVFLAVADCGSVTQAAGLSFVSQPAVTQAIAKLESLAGQALFKRSRQGLFLTDAGQFLERRARRAIGALDAALGDIAARLVLTATRPQLQALTATVEAQNFSLAARRLGVSQPSVHRAVSQLETEAGRPLFQRSHFGVTPTRQSEHLARVVRLTFAELDQAATELADLLGKEVGEIVIGAMPLSRSFVLPRALSGFRQRRRTMGVRIVEGSYDELLGGLRRGEIDFLIGALRDPVPVADVVQDALFIDSLVLVSGAGHPLLSGSTVSLDSLCDYPWLTARRGTPSRDRFEAMFDVAAHAQPASIIETGSIMLIRQMLPDNLHLACVSKMQAKIEIDRGDFSVLPWRVDQSERQIGLTFRADWEPTPAQRFLLDEIRRAGGEVGV